MGLELAALIVALGALLLVIILFLRQRSLLNRYRALLQGSSDQNLEQFLLRHAEQVEGHAVEIADLRKQVQHLATAARPHIQKSAMIRFNAFPDTGSDQSFAVALLDADNNGLVISSLYGRNESRIYAKPIRNGNSTYTLSDEEKQVLSTAMTQ